MFHEELATIAQICENIHYIPIITNPTESWKGETGFISKEIIQNHMSLFQGIPTLPGLTNTTCGLPDEGLKRFRTT